MRDNDKQLVVPYVTLKDTTANIEAGSHESGAIAYATDTDFLGYFDGTDWVWIGAPTDNILASITLAPTNSTYTPPNQTWTTFPITVLDYHGYDSDMWDSVNRRWTPPEGVIFTTFMGAGNGSMSNSFRWGNSINGYVINWMECRYNSTYNVARTSQGVYTVNGSQYVQAVIYRYNNGVLRNDCRINWTVYPKI